MHRFLSPRSMARGAAVVVAVVVGLLPGVAWAGDGTGLPPPPTDQLGTVTGPVGNLLGGAAGGQGSAPGVAAPNADPAPGATQQADTASTLPSPPPLDASQLQQLLATLGISEECSTAVQKDIQQTITDLPATVQAIVDSIVSQLQSGGGLPVTVPDPTNGVPLTLQTLGSPALPTVTAPSGADLPVVADLQQLLDDLQNKCQPTLPAPNPPSGGSQLPPAQPVSAPQPLPQPPPQAPAPPPAQPVSYPGYAPTGAPPVHSSDAVPLAALAGIVLLSGAGAASYRMVFRAGPRP